MSERKTYVHAPDTDRLVAFIAAHPGTTAGVVAEHFGISRTSAGCHLLFCGRRLRSEGGRPRRLYTDEAPSSWEASPFGGVEAGYDQP